jgi:hypothetical protein
MQPEPNARFRSSQNATHEPVEKFCIFAKSQENIAAPACLFVAGTHEVNCLK